VGVESTVELLAVQALMGKTAASLALACTILPAAQ
ncbi:hypothetical protein AVEN_48750-1, partial [Araneus ventricosus]